MSSERSKLSAEYALLAQLANELRSQLDLLNAALNEVLTAKAALEEVSKLKGGEELLIPLGGGVMIKASFKGEHKVLVNVGSNVIVEKDLEGAVKYLSDREQALRRELQQRASEYRSILERLRELESKMAQAGR